MTTKPSILILAAVCLCSAGSARPENFKQFYKGFIPKFITAFETGDIKFFDAISTPDFTDSEGGHTSTKAESLQQMKSQVAMTKKIKVVMHLMSAAQKGNTVYATTKMSATMVMKPDAKGKSHTISMDMVESETWVKVGSSWKIKALNEAKPSKMTMDGKPVDPSKMSG